MLRYTPCRRIAIVLAALACWPPFSRAETLIGYKAALTSPAAQEKFEVGQPVLGRLYASMILTNHTTLPPNFGDRPMTEGDLVVVVGSEAINHASTDAEILDAIEAVVPFLECPDLVYARDTRITGPMISAINAGARYGVLGDPVPVTPAGDWMERLGAIRLQILDVNNHVLAAGKSDALLGHPLRVVRWIRDTVRAEGEMLQPGYLLSLGTITPLMPVRPGTTVRAHYTNLDPEGPVEIIVHFSDE